MNQKKNHYKYPKHNEKKKNQEKIIRNMWTNLTVFMKLLISRKTGEDDEEAIYKAVMSKNFPQVINDISQ